METRTKQLWTMMAAITLAGAGLAPTAAATVSSDTTTITTSTTTTTAGGSTIDATVPTLSAGQLLVANKVAAPFVTMAGSQDNAVALATALRMGTTANLTFSSTSSTGETIQTTTALTIPTKPMGWGNVSHALALAQLSLRQAGIDNPTAADLQAALDGGTVTTADGKIVTLAGVLQQRAQGMGWGQIAKTYGTTMGAVNRGLKAPTTTVASPTSTPAGTTATTKGTVVVGATSGHGAKGITTASGANANNSAPGHGSKGLTTASGALANSGTNGHAVKGITTASNAIAGGSSGVVTAAGNGLGQGNAFGRGVVTAGGGGSNAAGARGGASAIVTGSGTAATPVTTGGSSGGVGDGSGHGKGKGGG